MQIIYSNIIFYMNELLQEFQKLKENIYICMDIKRKMDAKINTHKDRIRKISSSLKEFLKDEELKQKQNEIAKFILWYDLTYDPLRNFRN